MSRRAKSRPRGIDGPVDWTSEAPLLENKQPVGHHRFAERILCGTVQRLAEETNPGYREEKGYRHEAVSLQKMIIEPIRWSSGISDADLNSRPLPARPVDG
jgi:hypothetical protein